jgi:dephospho-CoA kinase
MTQNRQVFGLVGPIASGKGTVAHILEKKGNKLTSLSDRIREEIKKRGLSETRQTLQDVGNDLRKKYGDGVLAERTSQRYKNETRLAIDSVRNPEEIRVLKKYFDAIIIGVTASREKRWELVNKRKRKGDVTTWEEFLEKDKKEFGKRLHSQQVGECLKMSDFILKNEGTKKELERKTNGLLKKIAG